MNKLTLKKIKLFIENRIGNFWLDIFTRHVTNTLYMFNFDVDNQSLMINFNNCILFY